MEQGPGGGPPPPGAQPPPSSGAPPTQPQAPGYPPPPVQPQQPPPGAPPSPAYVKPLKQLPPAVAGRELASWGSRAGALLLDRLIEFGVFLLFGLALLLPGILLVDGDAVAIGVVLIVFFAALSVAFWLLFEPYLMNRGGQHNGQTLGKQIVGITVVRDQGERMDFGWAFVRQTLVIQGIPSVLNAFAAIFFIPVGAIALLLDYLWPLWDDQDNRCLHDMICSTHVVRAD